MTDYINWWDIPKGRWSKTQRDSQRSKLYKAEREIKSPLADERIETVPEIQKWVDKICSYAWFKRRFGNDIRIEVEDGRGRRSAQGERCLYRRLKNDNIEIYDGYIKLPIWARKKWVILHEMAHAVCPYKPGHGRYFARCFLSLIHHVLGYEVKKEFVEAFKKNKVKYNPFRVMTEEAKEAARERFKQFRSQKGA